MFYLIIKQFKALQWKLSEPVTMCLLLLLILSEGGEDSMKPKQSPVLLLQCSPLLLIAGPCEQGDTLDHCHINMKVGDLNEMVNSIFPIAFLLNYLIMITI